MLFQTYMLDAYANEAEYVDLNSQACEKVMSGESKSSTRLRASDKAVFLAVKKLDQLSELEKTLSDHDLNVLIYRFVDEYIEDLSIKTTEDTADKVCVDVTGRILLNNIQSVKEEYTINHTNPDIKKHEVKQIIEEVKQELKIKPDNPESLALVHVKQLEYFNGTPREIWFDNMATVMVKEGKHKKVHNEIKQLGNDIGFQPILCQARRPKSKGTVENLAKLCDRLKSYNNEFKTFRENVPRGKDLPQRECGIDAFFVSYYPVPYVVRGICLFLRSN